MGQYEKSSLNGTARTKRDQGVLRRVRAASTISINWQSFLRVDCNKTDLFNFLSEAVIKWFNNVDKRLDFTDADEILESN